MEPEVEEREAVVEPEEDMKKSRSAIRWPTDAPAG